MAALEQSNTELTDLAGVTVPWSVPTPGKNRIEYQHFPHQSFLHFSSSKVELLLSSHVIINDQPVGQHNII